MKQDLTPTPRQLPSSRSEAVAKWGQKFGLFLAKYPPDMRESSLLDAARHGGEPLVSMDRYFGEGSCVYWLKTQLIAVFSFLGLFGKVTEYQIRKLAEHIKAKYYYLTPAELMVFFSRFEDGEYALFRTQAVNPQMMMVSFPHFVADVQEARRQAEEEENARKAEAEKRSYVPPTAEEMKKYKGIQSLLASRFPTSRKKEEKK